MAESSKNNPFLPVTVLAGVTALAGGIEPVSAALSDRADVSVQDSHSLASDTRDPLSGNFSGSDNDTVLLDRFDDMGGALQLTGMTVTARTDEGHSMSLSLNGTCEVGEIGRCAAEATTETTFSVLINHAGGIPLLPTTQVFELSVQDDCEGDGCNFSDSDSRLLNNPEDAVGNDLVVQDFTVTITNGGILDQFVGPGTFEVLPSLLLEGVYGTSFGGENSMTGNVLATTYWFPWISVEYESRPASQTVPSPATGLLLAAGLAGAGVARSKKKKS